MNRTYIYSPLRCLHCGSGTALILLMLLENPSSKLIYHYSIRLTAGLIDSTMKEEAVG
jgi:hypothetical protein